MFSAELVGHDVWRKGPDWLEENEDNWNKRVLFDKHLIPSEELDIQKILLPVIASDPSLLEKNSSYSHLVCVTSWILRFANNTRKGNEKDTNLSFPCLSLRKLKSSGGGLCKKPPLKGKFKT